MRDSGQRKLTYSSQNHCTSTLRSGRRKTIVSQTMCVLAERLSQSEIVLPLRKACYYSPLAEVGVFSTEIKISIQECPLYSVHCKKKEPCSADTFICSTRLFFCFYFHPSDFHSFRKENSKTHLICDDVPLY